MLFVVSPILWISFVLSDPALYAAPNNFNGLNLKTNKTMEIDLKKPSKGTVIIFLSARCPCSASHIPEITSLTKEFNSRSLQFVVVHSNVDETEPSDRDYLKSLNLEAPILEDHKFEIANRFGALKTPHAFVISPDGEVLYMGGVSDRSDFSNAKIKYLRTALNQIVQGVSVDSNKTMSIGCSIRR